MEFKQLIAEIVGEIASDYDQVEFTRSPLTGTLTCVTPSNADGTYFRMLTLDRLCDGYSDAFPPAFTFDQFEAQFDSETVMQKTNGRPGERTFVVKTADLLAAL